MKTAMVVLLVVAAATGNGNLLQRFSRSHFAFSLDLYSALAAQSPVRDSDEAVSSGDVSETNLLFSPYSLSTALAMIFMGAGAGSSTSLQLRSALHLNNFSFSDVHATYKTVLAKLADPYYGQVLTVANGIFQQQESEQQVTDTDATYRRALEEFYGAQMQTVDFGRPPMAVAAINAWASNLTDGRISSLGSAAGVDQTTRLVLASGLAFRSQWLFRFDPAMTFDKGLFYTSSKKRFEIPMMIGRFKIPVGYSSDLECRIAELPFSSRRISLFIILPDDVDRGLAKLEANMSSNNVKALFSTLKDEVVNIRLPRFRLQNHQSVGVVQALKAMGIRDVFDSQLADLSGLSAHHLHVSNLIHKTFLEVGEDGVEAPGDAESGLNRLGAFGEKYFEVDHPFVFLLWDYHSGILLSLGRVTAPEPWTL